ncbi:MAG TPA: phosphatase PAP2 family protein [Candidatus Saccharimonadales bacterium]|nr:phosphatase PAP2 family protein [Candidatus Saccharimonadales bacterium]
MTTQTIVRLLADGMVIPIILIAGYALLFRIPKGQRFEAYKRIFMAGLTAYLFAKLLGAIYQPSAERPFETIGAVAGASYLPNPGFPSDHALFTMFLTLAVWFETRQKTLSVILLILTFLVCLGRVLALVHTPLDVIGGIVVALTGVVWYIQRTPKGEKVLKSKNKERV